MPSTPKNSRKIMNDISNSFLGIAVYLNDIIMSGKTAKKVAKLKASFGGLECKGLKPNVRNKHRIMIEIRNDV